MKLGITGHRPPSLGGYTTPNEKYNKVCAALKGKFEELKPSKIISGMAQGTDQWAAQIAIDLNIPFLAALPCDGMDKAWPDYAKDVFQNLLGQAERTIVVSPGPYMAWKMHERDRYIVDSCDMLLAVYDGRKEGGTYSTVRYAEKIKQKIVVINPDDL